MRYRRIRARLFFAFGTLLALMLVAVAVSLTRLEQISFKAKALIDEEANRVQLANQTVQFSQGAALILMRLLQTPEQEERKPLYLRMDAENAEADAALQKMLVTMVSSDLKVTIETLQRQREYYAEVFQVTVEQLELEGLLLARAHFAAHTEPALQALMKLTADLAARQRTLMQQEVALLHHSAETARWVAIFISLSSLLIGAALSYYIAQGIARPVGQAVDAAQAIASGDYGQPVPPGPDDEIGTLMQSMEVMRASIASREQHIVHLAYSDPMTGLGNRTYLLAALEKLHGDAPAALILINLDRFSLINSALGHSVGDHLLTLVAARLRDVAGPTAELARLGADEFCLLAPGTEEEMRACAERVLGALNQPIAIDDQRLDVSARAGMAHYPSDAQDARGLLRRADLALAHAKHRHESLARADEVADEPAHEQLALIGQMREALAQDHFEVHYQPKLMLATLRITGAEALIRWRHPTRGLVPPGRFIPFAEQTGFIREITPWLIQRVITDAAAWARDGHAIVASLNLLTHDLRDHRLIDLLAATLAEHALPPSQLCLEITESALMDDPEAALGHLQELADLGLKLSIDDYGSGQASLAYVKNLPVHELKIDRAFVSGVDHDPRNAAIVRSTLLLCRELGLSVVAEGAEESSEIDWLRENACDLVQGYGIAKPIPKADFLSWVSAFHTQ